MQDVVIRGGSVVDGTGAARRTADVAIHDGRITAIGRDVGSGRRTIDADGLIVAPGFIDVHTHLDVQGFWDCAPGHAACPVYAESRSERTRTALRSRSLHRPDRGVKIQLQPRPALPAKSRPHSSFLSPLCTLCLCV